MIRTADDSHLEADCYRIPFDEAGGQLPSKDIVGSKAHNLMRMARAGLLVPSGFVLPADLCRRYLAEGEAALSSLPALLERELEVLGKRVGRKFGDGRRPLLLSVRSGAAVSMPGMMETVLNVGLTPASQKGLVRMTGNPRVAVDCRRRLVQQYGEVAHGILAARFLEREREFCRSRRVAAVADLATHELHELCVAFEEIFEADTGEPFPVDPVVQLRRSVEAVLRSWSSDRAVSYRRIHGIVDTIGTAVTVQAMVYGNLGLTSGSGVGFTRNPATGQDEFYLDYLPNAQGEDVVAGRRRAFGAEDLEQRTPDVHRRLKEARSVLEAEFRDMQDFEFTVEAGTLFFLQSRPGKRTPLAALRIAHDLVAGGRLKPAEALARLEGIDLAAVDHSQLNVEPGVKPLARGISASVGVAVGRAAFDPSRMAELSAGGQPVVLFRSTAETADMAALAMASALVTAEGARTSHAAVVAREMGKPCIVACTPLLIDVSGRWGHVGDVRLGEGTMVSLDAGSGEVYAGELPVLRERAVELITAVDAWRQSNWKPPKRRNRP